MYFVKQFFIRCIFCKKDIFSQSVACLLILLLLFFSSTFLSDFITSYLSPPYEVNVINLVSVIDKEPMQSGYLFMLFN